MSGVCEFPGALSEPPPAVTVIGSPVVFSFHLSYNTRQKSNQAVTFDSRLESGTPTLSKSTMKVPHIHLDTQYS
jgi:hypothetical protein